MVKRQRAVLPAKLTGRGIRKTAEAGRDIWSGTISFSLVAIPVRLVEAIAPGRVSFRMLHRKDFSPLVSRMLCPREGKIVPREEIVRGYEVKPGRYIPITGKELDSVSPERSRTIEVTNFIDIREVDPIYYDYQYYLVPLKGGQKPYRLLVEVLRRTGKAGVASLVLADREYPVLVRSAGGLLAVNTLHYPDDIVPESALSSQAAKTGTVPPENRDASAGSRTHPPRGSVPRFPNGDSPTERLRRTQRGTVPIWATKTGDSPSERLRRTRRGTVPVFADAEKERMKRAIKKMVAKFNPEKYADRRRKRITALLKKKMKGKSLVQAPEVEGAEGEAPVDLVAALKASMRKPGKFG